MQASDLAAIPCPFCQRRPVESTAKATWVRGFVIAYQITTRTVIGCAPCVRTELFKEAGRSALLGWFSITAIFINPVLIVYNLARGMAVQPNPERVVRHLAEIGVGAAGGNLNLLQVGYSLAAAMVGADGRITEEELEVAVRFGQKLFEGFDPNQLRETCGRHKELPAANDLAFMLRDALTQDQKEAVFSYMCAIAEADGAIVDAEKAQLGAIAAGLNLDIQKWKANVENRA